MKKEVLTGVHVDSLSSMSDPTLQTVIDFKEVNDSLNEQNTKEQHCDNNNLIIEVEPSNEVPGKEELKQERTISYKGLNEFSDQSNSGMETVSNGGK